MADDKAEDLGTFDQTRREEAAEVGCFNLAVFGRGGTGKTTLITAVFGQQLTSTTTEPESLVLQYHSHPDGILGVYDSRAFAMDQESQQVLSRLQAVVEQSRARPLPEQLPAAWYTVRWNDAGFTADQAEFVRRLAELVPTMFVITQVPANIVGQRHQDAVRLSRYVQAYHEAQRRLAGKEGKDLVGRALEQTVLRALVSPENTVYLTNARADEFTASPVHGLQELLTATFASAPEAARRALAAAQLLDRERKRPASANFLVALPGAAAAARLTAIPVRHAGLLLQVDTGLTAA